MWDEEQNKWWFSAVDIVRAINKEENYIKAGNYWRWLKRKIHQESIQLVSDTHGFKFEAPDEGSVTNERLRYSLNLHKGQISELLKRMCLNGLLVSQGYGRGMRYYLPEGNHTNLFSTNKSAISSSDANITTLDINVATLKTNMATSTNSVATSTNNVATLQRKRLSKKQMNELIKVVCADWVSLEDIALQIGKNYNYLRNHIIPRMI